jgi:hypothetical protein
LTIFDFFTPGPGVSDVSAAIPVAKQFLHKYCELLYISPYFESFLNEIESLPLCKVREISDPTHINNRKKRRPKAKIHKITQEKTEKTCEL